MWLASPIVWSLSLVLPPYPLWSTIPARTSLVSPVFNASLCTINIWTVWWKIQIIYIVDRSAFGILQLKYLNTSKDTTASPAFFIPVRGNITHTVPQNQPSLIKEDEQNMYYDTKLCPTDPRVISFVRNNDIYVTSSLLKEYSTVRLTESPNSTGRL